MNAHFIQKLTDRARREQALLAAGEHPQPRLKSQVQRTAIRFLALFFALMLLFTLVSRAADGVTTARVQTDTVKSGVLTDRITVSGKIEPAGDVSLTLPEGIRVEGVHAKVGQRVSEGDPLLTIDQEALEQKRTELTSNIRILELKISAATSGLTGTEADGILTAQQTLEDAQQAYVRLEEKLERSELREAEDLLELEADLEKALQNYEKAVRKTREDLVKEAEDKVKLAKEALETAETSAQEAISSAKQALEQAKDNDAAANSSYDAASSAYQKASTRLQRAKSELERLLAQDPQDEGAIAEARIELAEAQTAYDAAESSYQSGNYQSATNTYYARQDLQRTQETWEKTIKKAKDTLQEAEDKLAEVNARTDFTDEAQVISAQSEVDSAERSLKTAQRNQEDGVYTKEDQLQEASRTIEAAQRDLESARRQATKDSQSDAASQRQAEIDRLTYQYEKQALEAQLRTLNEAAVSGGVVSAPMDGTVLSILEKGGKTTDGAAVSLSRSDQGFTFEGSLDQKSAQKLSPGDTGALTYTNEGKSNSVDVTIRSIGTADQEGNVEISAELPSGSYPSGISGELTITNRSEKHDACLPLSALRTSAEGDYVLILREKKTILGTEWVTVKVPITVKDRDSETMSVESALMWDDPVVTSADKTISEGDRVRLENE